MAPDGRHFTNGSRWSAYNSAGNAGYGLRRPSAISIGDGSLNIEASMENGSLVSGGLSHRHTQTYGRYEFRVRTDQDWSYTVHPVSATQWHTMEMEWLPDRLILRRDGQTVKTIWENDDDLIPDNPHFLAIQLDAWKHSVDRPVWMQVDYVKVWSYGGMHSS